MRFRKNPVIIEAKQWLGTEGQAEEMSLWSKGKCKINGGRLTIETLEGTMLVSVGDWVICGIAGEFYACKPNIFEGSYEEVK